eukprot:1186437-Prorocentrum_minimum.AAC.8
MDTSIPHTIKRTLSISIWPARVQKPAARRRTQEVLSGSATIRGWGAGTLSSVEPMARGCQLISAREALAAAAYIAISEIGWFTRGRDGAARAQQQPQAGGGGRPGARAPL